MGRLESFEEYTTETAPDRKEAGKEHRKVLQEDLLTEFSFEERRKLYLSKVLTDEPAKDVKSFKERFLTDFDEISREKEQEVFRNTAHHKLKPETNKKEVAERMIALQRLLESYKLTHASDIFDRSPEEIQTFAKEYGAIVHEKPENLIIKWIEIRKEVIEWEKMKILMLDDEASGQIYQELKSKGSVEFDALYTQHQDLFEKTTIAEREENLKLTYEAFVNKDTGAIQELERRSVQKYINSVGTYAVASTPNGWELKSNHGDLIGFNIQDRKLVFKDDEEEVSIEMGDYASLKKELKVFDIRSTLKDLIRREKIHIPIALPETFQKFLKSRKVAHLVRFISQERYTTDGVREVDSERETELIYGNLIKLDKITLMNLRSQLDAVKGPEGYRRIAENLRLL